MITKKSVIASLSFLVVAFHICIAFAASPESEEKAALAEPSSVSKGSGFNDIFFFDPHTGWMVGDNGLIVKTHDGGNTWKPLKRVTSQKLRSVYFPDPKHGWAVGHNGMILATSDGGNTWKKQKRISTWLLYNVFFVDSRNGWAVGMGATMLVTHDGGATWRHQHFNRDLSSALWVGLMKVHFSDLNRGVLLAQNSILFTRDGGKTWINTSPRVVGPTPMGGQFIESYFVDQNNGWVVGTSGNILVTHDGGETWEAQKSGVSRRLLSVHFLNTNDGWIVNESGNGMLGHVSDTLLITHDGGKNWIDLQKMGSASDQSVTAKPEEGLNGYFSRINFLDAKNGWALAGALSLENGKIMRSGDGGITWHRQKIASAFDTVADDTPTEQELECGFTPISLEKFSAIIRKIADHGDLTDMPFLEKTMQAEPSPENTNRRIDGAITSQTYRLESSLDNWLPASLTHYMKAKDGHFNSNVDGHGVIAQLQLGDTRYLDNCLHLTSDKFAAALKITPKDLSEYTSDTKPHLIRAELPPDARNNRQIAVEYTIEPKSKKINTVTLNEVAVELEPLPPMPFLANCKEPGIEKEFTSEFSTIAAHGDLTDVAFIEQALKVKFQSSSRYRNGMPVDSIYTASIPFLTGGKNKDLGVELRVIYGEDIRHREKYIARLRFSTPMVFMVPWGDVRMRKAANECIAFSPQTFLKNFPDSFVTHADQTMYHVTGVERVEYLPANGRSDYLVLHYDYNGDNAIISPALEQVSYSADSAQGRELINHKDKIEQQETAPPQCEKYPLTGDQFMIAFKAVALHDDLTDADFIQKQLQTEFIYTRAVENNKPELQENHYEAHSVLGVPLEIRMNVSKTGQDRVTLDINDGEVSGYLATCLHIGVPDINRYLSGKFIHDHSRGTDGVMTRYDAGKDKTQESLYFGLIAPDSKVDSRAASVAIRQSSEPNKPYAADIFTAVSERKSADLDGSLESCKSHLSKNSGTSPNQDAIHDCMRVMGFAISYQNPAEYGQISPPRCIRDPYGSVCF